MSLEEIELKLRDLNTAISLERKHQFTDVQGKKQRFSQFALKTLSQLEPFLRSLNQEKPEAKTSKAMDPIERSLHAMRQYPFAALGERMKTLDTLEALLKKPKPQSLPTQLQVPSTEIPAKGSGIKQIGVQFVKGVGPRLAQLLHRIPITSVQDLIYYFPKKYLDYQQRLAISSLVPGQEATVMGWVKSISAFHSKGKDLWIITLTIADESSTTMTAKWVFAKANRAVLESFKSRFAKGMQLMISGKVKWDSYTNKPSMDRPDLEILSYEDETGNDGESPETAEANAKAGLHTGRIVPVYPLIEGLNLKWLRRAIRQALDSYLPEVHDPMPEALRKRCQLCDLGHALETIHFPPTFDQYHDARRRLVFDELFYLQVRLAMIQRQYKQTIQGMALTVPEGGLTERFLQQLPFKLTGAQQRVFEEIKRDMALSEPMYRLLQGDVGSGKTIVALLTMLIGIDNGYQSVMMVPTEILAEQHYRRFIEWLTPMGLKVGLVVGKAGSKERREVRQGLLNGQIHLAVGTHALIQDDVEFQRLGVVVVDEQHRFGVRQRILLKNKGESPELLTMTATPIPRTLAMTLHGDLDVSVIDELPPGRTPIQTVLFKGKTKRHQAYDLIEQEIQKGRQAYIVFPLIEESETISAKSATVEFEHLTSSVFPNLRVGLLHGKLSTDEKDTVMSQFASGKLDILVATTVIEVGVDVPNATVMIIDSADRFGLAQLHQLRGRVGRGGHQSYCLLLTESKTDETIKRLSFLCSSTNGFDIAQHDLETRGPGEFLGTRQSGMPDFVLADLLADSDLLELARQQAFQLVESCNDLAQDYPLLYDTVFEATQERFQHMTSG